MARFLLFLLSACAVAEMILTPGVYNTAGGPVNDKLNVHVVAHTHDDVGWLKTVDQYYMGANNSIQPAAVQYILDSVVAGLVENPDRKFIYVEIAFFKRWWDEQSPAMQATVKKLVATGQLEFINGGWCMSDEATPSYIDMIDQQTLGHQFLLATFGKDAIPRAGWQIDPFGHSTTMATLYSLMGMDSWHFGRLDYQDRSRRITHHTMELVSRPSPSLGAPVDLFTQVLNGYGPLPFFDFEVDSSDAPLQDDPRLQNENVRRRVEEFVVASKAVATQYNSNNILLTMGSDFDYINANTWFKNLDKLIHYTNQDGRINAFYSTPTLYTRAVHAANLTWSTKDDDFFPYADKPQSFWTGYFTSRPALKGYVRSTSNLLQSCRQVEAQVPPAEATSQRLWEAMGVAQHHDAVSGTEKQHVAYDYARRLSTGAAECDALMAEGLGHLLGTTQPLALARCPLLNESICPQTQLGQATVVVAYNALGQARNEMVRLPVPARASLAVFDWRGQPVVSELDGTTLVFNMQLPPMGYAAYFVDQAAHASASAVDAKPATGAVVSIENDVYRLDFASDSGLLAAITNKQSGVTTKATQYWGWYNSSSGDDWEKHGQASGAYIFRPYCHVRNEPTEPCRPHNITPPSGKVELTVHIGKAYQEVQQVFAPWLRQTVRLNGGTSAVEVEYTLGPVPVTDGWGKEIVSVFQTDLENNRTFYTDSNGREMLQRVFNYRPTWSLTVTNPVAGNYYPVTRAAYGEDVRDGRRLTVLVDRANGGASIEPGQLEIMVHRRCLHDDNRGVDEPLNEPGTSGLGLVVTGVHRVVFDTAARSTASQTDAAQRLAAAPLLYFAPLTTTVANFVASHATLHSGLTKSLPPNVHLLTVQDNSLFGGADTLLLRLAHLYANGEDPVLSQPATVTLSALFSQLTLADCVEMSLTANQVLTSMSRLQWQTPDGPAAVPRAPALHGDVLTLQAMDIRTVTCVYQKHA